MRSINFRGVGLPRSDFRTGCQYRGIGKRSTEKRKRCRKLPSQGGLQEAAKDYFLLNCGTDDEIRNVIHGRNDTWGGGEPKLRRLTRIVSAQAMGTPQHNRGSDVTIVTESKPKFEPVDEQVSGNGFRQALPQLGRERTRVLKSGV
jgi:hypothetical protein